VIVHDMYRNSVIYSDVHHQVTRLGLVGSIKATYTGFQFTSTDVHCGTTVYLPSSLIPFTHQQLSDTIMFSGPMMLSSILGS
jgi:hypothetical protein